MRVPVVVAVLLLVGCGSTRTVTVTKRVVATTTVVQRAPAPPTSVPPVVRPPLWWLAPAGTRLEDAVRLGPRDLGVVYSGAPLPGSSLARRTLALWRRGVREWRLVGRFARSAYAFELETADLTGDGAAEVLVHQDEDGSGVCGFWRVFQAEPRFHEVFVRAGCLDNREVHLVRGRVVVWDGIVKDPRSGSYIHCCWSRWRRTELAWNGRGLVVVSRRLVGPPPDRRR
jgi:hypothetical protein